MNFTGTANNLLINLATEQWPYAVDGIATQLQQCLEHHQQAEPHFELTVMHHANPIVVQLFITPAMAAELALLPDSQQQLQATAQAIANALERPVHFMLSEAQQMSALVKANMASKATWQLTQTTAFGQAQHPFVVAAIDAPLIIDEVIAKLNELPSLAELLRNDAIVIYCDESGVTATAPDHIQVTVKGQQVQLSWPDGNLHFAISTATEQALQPSLTAADEATAIASPITTMLPQLNQRYVDLIGFIDADGITIQSSAEPAHAPSELQLAGITSIYPAEASAPITEIFGRSMFKKQVDHIQAKATDGTVLPALTVGFSRHQLKWQQDKNTELGIAELLSDLPVQIIRNGKFELLEVGDVISLTQTQYLKAGLAILKIEGADYA